MKLRPRGVRNRKRMGSGVRHNIYRDGKVHVLAEQCSTCIFRPGNLMHLSPGRLKDIVNEASSEDGSIVCHQTLEDMGSGENAVCLGFFDRYKTTILQIAERMNVLKFVPAPEKGIAMTITKRHPRSSQCE